MADQNELETKYKQLYSTMMDAFGAVDMDGRIKEANQPFLDLVGYEMDELLTMSIYDLTPPRWHELENRIINEQILVQGYSEMFQKEYRRKDGTSVPVELRIVLNRDTDGNPIGMWAIVHDLTERIEKEETLRRFQYSVESSPDAVFWMNEQGRFPYVNDQACHSLGYTQDELRQLHLWDIDPNITREEWPQIWERDKSRGGARLESMHRRKDGTVFPVDISSKNIVFDGNVHHVAYVRDISVRKKEERAREKLEAQLIQAQKMESIGRLAGGVAHDYNNMLSVILGYSELMRSKLSPDDPVLSELDQIQHAAMRSKDITQQLLAFSRKQVFQPKILNINDIIRGFESNLSRLIGEDVNFHFSPSPEIENIEFDPTQIEQIIMNLAVNARDAMPQGGKLTIETSNVSLDEAYCREHVGFLPGDFVQIAVSDDGIGMAAESINQIFEPFYTTKEIGKGTGLGLATVYGIVKQGGGFINVYSEPEQGTTFKIYIPIATGEAEVTEKTVQPLPELGSETVFLVEDDAMVRKTAEAILEKLGYKVISVADPEAAIAIFQKEHRSIDLLITDVVMPKMNGKILYNELKSIRPDLKVLYMSGYTDNVIVHHGVLDKGVQFVSKPFNINSLAIKVRETLDTK
jgi:two-component system, cell cycle sensor histidine kinase and response regulator CckA